MQNPLTLADTWWSCGWLDRRARASSASAIEKRNGAALRGRLARSEESPGRVQLGSRLQIDQGVLAGDMVAVQGREERGVLAQRGSVVAIDPVGNGLHLGRELQPVLLEPAVVLLQLQNRLQPAGPGIGEQPGKDVTLFVLVVSLRIGREEGSDRPRRRADGAAEAMALHGGRQQLEFAHDDHHLQVTAIHVAVP